MTSDLYAPPHCPFFVFFFCTFCRCLFGDAVASLPDEFFDDDELMVGLGSAKSCKMLSYIEQILRAPKARP